MGSGAGRALVIIGALLILAGLAISFGDRIGIRFGRLPGDFVYRGKNTTVYFPVATSILLSLALTLLLWLFSRGR